MHIPTVIRRCVSILIVAMMIGGPSVALADTTIDFTIDVQPYGPGVCSVTASAGGSVTLTRYSTILWNNLNASGPLTLSFDTTGLVGDRNCYSTASNTDFTNAAGTVTLVGSNSLSMTSGGSPVYTGHTTPSSFINETNIPTGGTAVDLTWYIIATVPNPEAPAGTYTSTMTITLSNTAI